MMGNDTKHVDVIVTCATLPVSDLCGESIKISNQAASDPDQPKSVQEMLYLKVCYGKDRLWYIPLNKCQTWFVSLIMSLTILSSSTNHVVIYGAFCGAFYRFCRRIRNSDSRTCY
jgi:hypothetical protein